MPHKSSLSLPKKLHPCFEVNAVNNNHHHPMISAENFFFLCGALLTVMLIVSITFRHPLILSRSDKTPVKTDTDFSVVYAPESSATESDKININTADIYALMELPGVGETTAKAILDYRDEHGLFHSEDELINVSGIGEKKLADILPHVTVN